MLMLSVHYLSHLRIFCYFLLEMFQVKRYQFEIRTMHT